MTTMMVVGGTLIQMPNSPPESDRVAVVVMADGIMTQMTIRDRHPDVKNAVVPDLTVVDPQREEVVAMVGLTTDVVVIVVVVMIAAVVMIVVAVIDEAVERCEIIEDPILEDPEMGVREEGPNKMDRRTRRVKST